MAIQGHDILSAGTILKRIETTKAGVPVVTTDEIAYSISGTSFSPSFVSLTDKLTAINTAVANIPTTTTVSNWGFTKNVGTVTKVNNTSPDANGNVTINIPSLSVSATGTGFIKDFSVNGHSITITKEDINTYFNVGTTTSTAFSPCGGNDTVSGNNHKVTVVTGISANGSTITANMQQIDFGTLHNTLSSILTRLAALEQRVSTIEENGTAPKQVTVTFNADGGTCSITTLQVNIGGTIPVMPIPTKSNYSFLGWYNGSTQYTTATAINAAVTLTAKWQAVTKYATITTYPTGKSLTYNGESQEIINRGVGTNGVFYYNTTASDTGKSSTVSDSALKRTNAGEYTAYYKFVADAGYTYTNSVWTPVTTTISAVKATITNPNAKTVTFGTNSTVTLSYTGVSKVSVTSSNTNVIAASVSGNKLTLSAKTGTGSATITVNGTPENNYTAPTAVTFTATAAKANNAITMTPADTTVNVNNGLHDGNAYYTISNISSTSKTSSTVTSSDISMLYFISTSSEHVSSASTSGNSSVTAYFNPSGSASSAKLTISTSANDNYTAASKTITFNFNKTTTYKYYVGTTAPAASNIDSIGTTTAKSEWSAVKSVSHTNVSGVSAPIYYCFPTDWNMIFYDEDKVSEVALASVSTFSSNGVNYTVLKTGRNVSNGSGKDYYAKAN